MQNDPEQMRDMAIAAARRHAAAMRTNALTGHQQTLETLAESLAMRMSQSGVTERMIRAALSCGPMYLGQLLIEMIQAGIDDAAEVEAVREVERAAYGSAVPA